MIRLAAIIVLALVLGLGGYYLITGYQNKKAYEALIKESEYILTPLSCDLNKTPCEVDFKGEKIKFEFKDKNIFAMQPLVFVISNVANLGFKNPSLRAFGLNMYMGNIDINLKQEDDKYIAKMVLSACLIDTMRYRFEVLDGGKETGLFIDFDLKI